MNHSCGGRWLTTQKHSGEKNPAHFQHYKETLQWFTNPDFFFFWRSFCLFSSKNAPHPTSLRHRPIPHTGFIQQDAWSCCPSGQRRRATAVRLGSATTQRRCGNFSKAQSQLFSSEEIRGFYNNILQQSAELLWPLRQRRFSYIAHCCVIAPWV